MKSISTQICIALALFGGARLAAAAESDKRPKPAARQVDFHKDVLAILANSCAKCHAGGQKKGGLSIDTRESLLAGGESGPAVVVGKSERSRLIELVAGLEPEAIMPAQGPRLTAEQVGLLRAWIDQGLAWEEGFSFKRVPSAPIEPRRIALPIAAEGSKSSNPIDLLLAPSLRAAGIDLDASIDDRTYIRRIYLDLVGLAPSLQEVDTFLGDHSLDKRDRLAQRLLDDKQQYAVHWLTFWNDALRNDYRGTGYIDGGRLQITDWLAGALTENMPYDEFVRQLINPSKESSGFINGIVWRGVVNASQVPAMQAAQNISQVFLGINLKCASCHDSFISDWKLTDAYGLAGIFSETPLEIHRCDQPTGKFAEVRFLFPQLGSIDAAAPRAERLRQLAEVMTRRENGRTARTIVNRLWARLLGRGLVEPVDEMDNPPWNADLLDMLANDLVDHGYDLKHTIARIVGSRTYQLASVGLVENNREDFEFRGPLVRRLSAEQFVDAVAALAGIEYAQPAAKPKSLRDASPPNSIATRAGARAALVNADPLLIALGRSNREQIVTERPKTATTLQALELTNGTPLAALLEQGAKKWVAAGGDSAQLTEQIYRRALLRAPNDSEQTLALELLGPTPTAEGVEDLLWALIMLPEFQLIY